MNTQSEAEYATHHHRQLAGGDDENEGPLYSYPPTAINANVHH